MTTSTATLIQIATDLQANSTKLEIITMARAFGWKGDHARAPMLQLALFVATKLAAQDKPQEGGNNAPQAPEQARNEQQAPEQARNEQQAPEQAQDDQQAPEQAQNEQDQQQAPEQAQNEQDDQQAPEQAQNEQDDQQAPEQDQGQQDEEEEPEAAEPNEYAKLLKASGIHNPHRLLEKVWLLTAKAKLNLMLVGPAGSGKTMIAEQLAQLLKLPFGSVSCTMGMSESQLTGWLMPREGGNFKYTPAPFINCMQSASVFLLDEVDAADANVMIVLNSALSNGFISVPQRIDEPMVKRISQSIVIAGANALNGGNASYSARSDLDGATKDRFYTLAVDYDMGYIKGLFDADRKTSRKSPRWKATSPPDQFGMDAAREFIVNVMGKVQTNKMQKIIGTRFAQKMAAALKVGIPFDEVKNDLFMGYTADELTRIGAN